MRGFSFPPGIFFQSNKSGNVEIYSYEISTGNWEKITNNPSYDGTAKINPASNKLAFWSWRGGTAEYHIMNLENNEVEKITDGLSGGGVPSWNPEGNKFTYFSYGGEHNEIYYYDVVSKQKIQLTKLENFNINK